MVQRDEFSISVKRTVAGRAGGLCSKPDCRCTTSGPGLEDAKALNIGVAAHITAASPGGPRYEACITAEERKSASNAIWLCQNCAKIIDSDPDKFTTTLIRNWKHEAESYAYNMLGKPAYGPLAQIFSLQRQGSGTPLVMERTIESDSHSEIDEAAEWIGRGQPQVAIDLLEKLKKRRWDQLSPREKYRILANIGNARLTQQKDNLAAAAYAEAAEYQPDDQNARALTALAYHLLGDREQAYELAALLCMECPHLSRAHMIRVRCSPETSSLDDLINSVPITVRSDPEIILALHDRALAENRLADAEQLIRENLKESNNWAALTLALGSTVLQQVVDEAEMGFEGPILVDSGSRLSEAIELFNTALDQIPEGDSGQLSAIAYLNRSTCHRLIGEDELAREDIRTAWGKNQADERIAISYALSMLRDSGGIASAIEMVERYLQGRSSLLAESFLADLLRQRAQDHDLERALKILEPLQSQFSQFPPTHRVSVTEALVDIYIRTGQDEKALRFAFGIPDDLLGKVTKAVAQGSALLRLDRHQEALDHAIIAKEEVVDSTDWHEVRQVAVLLERLGEHKDAFDLWRRIVVPRFVSVDTVHLLACARRAGEHDFLLTFCEELRSLGQYDTSSIEHEVNTLLEYNEFTATRRILLEFIKAKPNDKIARLHLTTLAIVHGWEDIAQNGTSDLLSVEETESAELGREVVEVLRLGPNPNEAVDYAYRLYRRFPDEAAAQRAMIASVLVPGPVSPSGARPEEVALGTAVCYREVDSEKTHWFVVEDEADASLSRDEYRVSHTLVKSVLGKKRGDEFVLEGRFRECRAIIVDVADKKIFRANDLADKWAERFPDQPFLERISAKSDKSQEVDFTFIESIAKRQAERRDQIESFYSEGRLSISSFALLMGGSVFQAMGYLAESRGMVIKVCRGNEQNYRDAQRVLDETSSIVVDSSAILTLALLEEVNVLKSLPFHCVVTESSLQELRVMVGLVSPTRGSVGYMGYQHGRLFFHEVREEEECERRERLEGLLSYLEENCRVVGGRDLAKIESSNRRRLKGLFAISSVESLATAIIQNIPLWTDDGLFYDYANFLLSDLDGRAFSALRAWTQSVFMWAESKGILGQQHLSQVAARMLRFGYSFTRLKSVNVLDTCERTSWNVENADLRAVLSDFGNPTWTSDAALNMTINSISEIWKCAPLEEQAREVTRYLLINLARRPDFFVIVNCLYQNADQLLSLLVTRAESLKTFLRIVLRTGVMPL